MKVKWDGEELTPEIGQYVFGGTPSILLKDDDGNPWVKATVYVDGLEDDEVAIKDYSENEGVLDALLEAKIVAPPHRFVEQGWVRIPVCRLL